MVAGDVQRETSGPREIVLGLILWLVIIAGGCSIYWGWLRWQSALLLVYGLYGLAIGATLTWRFWTEPRRGSDRIRAIASAVAKRYSWLTERTEKAQEIVFVFIGFAMAVLAWPYALVALALHGLTARGVKAHPGEFINHPLYTSAYFALAGGVTYALAVPSKSESPELLAFLGAHLLAMVLHYVRVILGPHSMLDLVRLSSSRPRLAFFGALILEVVALALILPVIAKLAYPHQITLKDMADSLQGIFFHSDLVSLVKEGKLDWDTVVTTGVGIGFDIAVLQLVLSGLRSARSDSDWVTLAFEHLNRGEPAKARECLRNVQSRSFESIQQEAMIDMYEGDIKATLGKLRLLQELRQMPLDLAVAYHEAASLVMSLALPRERLLALFEAAIGDAIPDTALVMLAANVRLGGVTPKALLLEGQRDPVSRLRALASDHPVTFAHLSISAFLTEEDRQQAEYNVHWWRELGRRWHYVPVEGLARLAFVDTLTAGIPIPVTSARARQFYEENSGLLVDLVQGLDGYEEIYLGLVCLGALRGFYTLHKVEHGGRLVEALIARCLDRFETHTSKFAREIMEAALAVGPAVGEAAKWKA